MRIGPCGPDPGSPPWGRVGNDGIVSDRRVHAERLAHHGGRERGGRAVAHRLCEVIAIYPITPSSPWASSRTHGRRPARPTCGARCPRSIEMQSEGGAAGALHGALQAGALATTFTASQGLLLMIPNMFKIAGELTPAVIHVAARTVATHALSIFGDHSDVMAARDDRLGDARLARVQEAHDLAADRPRRHPRGARAVPALLRRVPDLARGRRRSSRSTTRCSARMIDDRPGPRAPRRGPCRRTIRCCAAPPRTPTCSSRRARPRTRSIDALPGDRAGDDGPVRRA